jgi:hypothetical protein
MRQGIACRPPIKVAKKLFNPKPTDIYSSLDTDSSQGQLNPQYHLCENLKPHILSARHKTSTGCFYKFWGSHIDFNEVKVSWDLF